MAWKHIETSPTEIATQALDHGNMNISLRVENSTRFRALFNNMTVGLMSYFNTSINSGKYYQVTASLKVDGSTYNFTVPRVQGSAIHGKISTSTSINLMSGMSLEATYSLYEEVPPPTPSSITVPETVKGGENLQISWGSSSGATRYHLERSINGGAYTEIYQGANRNYTDSIVSGWDTVIYRVRAYDSGGYSSYRTSAIRNISPKVDLTAKIYGGGIPKYRNCKNKWGTKRDRKGHCKDRWNFKRAISVLHYITREWVVI